MKRLRRSEVLDSLGGEDGVLRLVATFYSLVAKNEVLKPIFSGKSLRCATEELSAYLVQFFDGETGRSQYRWWISLRASHARFQITEEQRVEWLSLMSSALEFEVADPLLRAELYNLFEAASESILYRKDSKIHHPDLECRWRRQLVLEEIQASIQARHFDSALALASEFVAYPSLFAGIAAEMMKYESARYNSFLLDSLNFEPSLIHSEFNGKSLLHHACLYSNVELVEELLQRGCDPNLADSSGHPPLIRAASRANAGASGDVIRLLVKAGAVVNHASGSQHVTAQHMAARRGNLDALIALKEVGANLNMTDKNGVTPLKRALNCRQKEVAEWLARQSH